MDSQSDSPAGTTECEPVEEPFENELCLHCAQSNAPLTKFCRHCRAPIHPLSAWCPYERIYATGFIWRAAISTPRKPMVLVGIYLFFLPSFLFNALMLRELLRGHYFEYAHRIDIAITLTPMIIYAALTLLMLIKTTSSYLKNRT